MTLGKRNKPGRPLENRELLPIPAATGTGIAPAGSDRDCEAAIARLFEAPFQIDRIREQAPFELVGRDREDVDGPRQWLTFFLCGEEYAIDIEVVNEIIKPREITDIPRVPEFVLGIISLRGIIVPVYDLARRLGLGSVDRRQPNRIVVCQREDYLVGLLVDNIRQVVRLKEAGIEAAPAVLSGPDRDFISGVGRYQGRMLILLQLKNILNPEFAWRQERSFR